MKRKFVNLVSLFLFAGWLAAFSPTVSGQVSKSALPPVIDVHMHAVGAPGDLESESAAAARAARLAALNALNVRYAVLSGAPDAVEAWHRAAPDRVIPSLLFPCEKGLVPNAGGPCFGDGVEFPDVAWVRSEIKAGRLKALGEITAQYMGIPPNDGRLEPYFALAEEFDIPVGIHLGLGPRGIAYPSSPLPVKSPNFRAAAGNPLLLEEVLAKHPRLRVWVMHAGWPLANEMLYILHMHPQVYVDVAYLHYGITRAEYYGYLRRLVEAGHGTRIMFGSDGRLKEGIEAILQADFLNEDQKRDILYNNAARFLRIESGQSQQ